MIPILLLLASFSVAAEPTVGPRDWLWHIVDACLDRSAPDYCARCKRPLDGACGKIKCEDSTEVWSDSADFVAIRDRKMCGCPKTFVHGLTIPRKKTAGVEDPAKPDAVWPFAWTAARSRIKPEGRILLAVNAPGSRTQDQLHVHLIRLSADGRRALQATKPERAASLSDVWPAAARHAKKQGLADGAYGVAVARDPRGTGYLVVADGDGHPETRFGEAVCR